MRGAKAQELMMDEPACLVLMPTSKEPRQGGTDHHAPAKVLQYRYFLSFLTMPDQMTADPPRNIITNKEMYASGDGLPACRPGFQAGRTEPGTAAAAKTTWYVNVIDNPYY